MVYRDILVINVTDLERATGLLFLSPGSDPQQPSKSYGARMCWAAWKGAVSYSSEQGAANSTKWDQAQAFWIWVQGETYYIVQSTYALFFTLAYMSVSETFSSVNKSCSSVERLVFQSCKTHFCYQKVILDLQELFYTTVNKSVLFRRRDLPIIL